MALGLSAPPREQTRARYPDRSGHVERDGVRIHYEVYGAGEPTVLLLPTWSIIHSQNCHVRHRLERYGAGRRMGFDADGPSEIAVAIAEEIGRDVEYRPVETDGAARAAALIAELI
jgi:hypothetical protein